MPPPPFQSFLDSHRDEVLRFLRATAGPQDAEDCFQETFLSAMRAYPRLRDGSNLRGWILTIAHRKALDAHRARGRRPLPVEDPGEGPEGAVEVGEDEAELWALVRELPARQRAAVSLRYVCDLSHAEIGGLIGCSEEASRRSVHEGLNRLRGALAA